MLLVTVAFMNGEALGIRVIVDQDAEANSDSTWFTANDMDGAWDASSATIINLAGTTAHITGGGAYAYNGDVVISNAGRYVVSGTLTDGGITVDTTNSAKVWLLFNGVDISCDDDACLRVDQADKVFLTLGEGTENRLTSGAVYSQEALADNTDGTIFAHDDLTINGSGSLTVTAGYKHGIAANDCLVITGGTIAVTAPQDALRANDSFRLREADITVDAGDDGLAVAGDNSVPADTEAGGSGVSARSVEAGNNGAASEKNTGYFYMESGSLAVTAAQDGLKAAGDITVAGGSVTVDAGDDGIHSDTAVTIAGGAVSLNRCYEGIEAPNITVSGGDTTVYPKDDGLNANGGTVFFPGADITGTVTPFILVSGGTLTVVNDSGRDADGLDSNGDIIITGGDVRISLPSGGSNSALDYSRETGGKCVISGGTVVACGSYDMAEGFDETSTQCSVLYNISAGIRENTVLTLADSRGNVLLQYTVPCGFSSALISAPGLTVGETCILSLGDATEEIPLTDISASFGDVQSGAFFGPMGGRGSSIGQPPEGGMIPPEGDPPGGSPPDRHPAPGEASPPTIP